MNGLFGDILNIVSIYATTAVTLELITLAREGCMGAYSNVLWKEKLRYETRGRMVDPAVIESDKRTSTDVWFRYYLARNRTFWGTVMRVRTSKDDSLLPIPLPTPATSVAVWARNGERPTLTICQLDDMRVIITADRGKMDTRTLPFGERIREYVTCSSQVFFITERGNVYRIRIDLNFPVTVKLSQLNIGNDVIGIARIGAPDGNRRLSLVLRRDGTLNVYTDWRLVPGSTDGTKFIQIKSAPAPYVRVLRESGRVVWMRPGSAGDEKLEVSIVGDALYDIENRAAIDGWLYSSDVAVDRVAMSCGNFCVLSNRQAGYCSQRRGRTILILLEQSKYRTQFIVSSSSFTALLLD